MEVISYESRQWTLHSDIGDSLAKRVAKRKLERLLLCSSHVLTQSSGWYWVDLGFSEMRKTK